MASRLPVIVSAAGGPEEVLGDAGVVLPGNEPAQLAAAVNALLSDPDARERLGRAARQRAHGFSWSAAARTTYDAYLAMLADLVSQGPYRHRPTTRQTGAGSSDTSRRSRHG
jgi:glycosyltransferase involved in cell wall biosynthesis